MPNLIVGLGMVFGSLGWFGGAMADVTARFAGDCSYLSSMHSGTNLSTAQTYCTSVGTGGCTSATGVSGSSSYPYCGASKWYDSEENSASGTAIFCFSTIANCRKILGFSAINTNASTTTEKNKGIALSYAHSGSVNYGTSKTNITVQNTEFFDCTTTCADWDKWYASTGSSVYESRQKQYCMSNGTCRSEMSTNTCQVRCPTGYYDTKGHGVSTGLAPVGVTCALCTTGTGLNNACVTSEPGATLSECMISSNCEMSDVSGKYLYTENCLYGS